jgi:hypothetical protein
LGDVQLGWLPETQKKVAIKSKQVLERSGDLLKDGTDRGLVHLVPLTARNPDVRVEVYLAESPYRQQGMYPFPGCPFLPTETFVLACCQYYAGTFGYLKAKIHQNSPPQQ